jgi:hypothetical protein
VEKRSIKPPEGWQFQAFQVLPGLFLAKRLVEPYGFASLGVDAIVALDDWEYTWSPPVPENHLYVHFPIDDAARSTTRRGRSPGWSRTSCRAGIGCWFTVRRVSTAWASWSLGP